MKHRPMPDFNSATIALFWSHVDQRGADECWLWLKATDKNGYGKFSRSKMVLRAHRVSYYLHTRVDPANLLVCHTCDNPGCCNPSHLFLGNNRENILDARDKGRLNPRSGDEHGLRVHPEAVAHGEQRPEAKLTEAQAREVRKLYATEQLTQQQIADQFGVTREAIGRIIQGKNWKHIIGDDEPISLSDPARRIVRGGQQGNSKLTSGDVRFIRKAHADHTHTHKQLANRFHVSIPTIQAVVYRKSWNHID